MMLPHDLDPAAFAWSLARTAKGRETLSILLHFINGPALTLSQADYQALIVLLLRSRRSPSEVREAIHKTLNP